MKLIELLSGVFQNIECANSEIIGLTSDSRKVRPGFLFVALSEVGDSFIDSAIGNGAVVIISHKNQNQCRAIFFQHDEPRKAYSRLAKNFHRKQPANIVAVTGTNGKSSVVNFCQQLWNSAKLKSVSVGTIGVVGDIERNKYGINLTTPDAGEMHCILNDLVSDGIDHVVIEASSQGLSQYRIHNINVCAAAFTQLSQDHYDYHNNRESYFLAKSKLFSEVLTAGGVAVLNSDIPEYKCLLNDVGNRAVISYGTGDSDVRLIKQTPKRNGQIISFSIKGDRRELFLPILGRFQAYNIMCAIGLVVATGVMDFHLESLKSIVGRMQLIEKDGYKIVIDYAHNPAALESSLRSLRWHLDGGVGRLILVFGCGGDRDESKRSIMGKVADDYADVIIVTDDNPRNEDPALIRAKIISECSKAIEVPDRQQAIIVAINEAKQGDVVLIAGKGHEHDQIVGSTVIPYDDYSAANSALRNLLTSSK